MTTPVNPLSSHQYWESLRAQGFSLPQCQTCKEFHFYLRPACPACGSLDIQAVVTSGRGNVYSFSIVYRAPSPAFEKDVPYVVAIVATDLSIPLSSCFCQGKLWFCKSVTGAFSAL